MEEVSFRSACLSATMLRIDRHIFGDAGIPTFGFKACVCIRGTRGMRGDRRLQINPIITGSTTSNLFTVFSLLSLFCSLSSSRFNRSKEELFARKDKYSIFDQVRGLRLGAIFEFDKRRVIALLDPSIGRRPNSIRTTVRPSSHLQTRMHVGL